ncbi:MULTISPECIES: terminase small subunit [Lactobacillus]|uniref:Terminase small subunit n=1 Tax=Lactobacillus xujianguonis TaxID=2495899 RepID=A0A437STH7_9LACO|nr:MULTISPECIES: terminase small subunit [Lactobacillus]RVU70174.1 terminase small subunit [Lactobacillus xujianguonis]RVU73521.1 terminase small subunit [Lactobacillus xujianguonis]
MGEQKLTIKQKKFADEYVKTGNATEAYKNAGYKVDSMTQNALYKEASKTLRKPRVKAYIDKRMKKIEDNKIMGAKEALEQLTKIARGEPFVKMIKLSEDDEPEPDLVIPKPADMLNALKEILKRYPLSEMDKAQIKRAQAEAVRAESEAQVAKAQAEQLHTVANNTREKMAKLSVEELRNIAKLAGEDDD